MKILMIAINDPAGTAIEFTKAVNRHTEHSCRLITKEIRYNFMFEKDLHLPWLDTDGWEEVEELLKTSDVFHFHMTADEYTEIGPFRAIDYMKDKLIVHHHHGHPDFRGNPEKYRQKYQESGRQNLLVSTPDLLKLLPDARWQPNLVPIDDPLYTPLKNKQDDTIVISHSPTRKDLKNTVEFIQAVNDFKKASTIPFELRLIENTPHKDCLRLKRESHILFDHLQGYFGVSSLEGLSQGLCVIAGLDEWNRKHIETFARTTKIPWVCMSSRDLMAQLKALLNNTAFIKQYAEASRRFMKTCWSDARIVRQLISVYE
jgi:hypothetical protein